MIAKRIAEIIADFVLFLDLTDDERLNPDEAVEMMELLAHRLQGLGREFLCDLVDAFPVLASEYTGESQRLVLDIPHSFYLEEAIAADDPVKLAELEALRDARE